MRIDSSGRLTTCCSCVWGDPSQRAPQPMLLRFPRRPHSTTLSIPRSPSLNTPSTPACLQPACRLPSPSSRLPKSAVGLAAITTLLARRCRRRLNRSHKPDSRTSTCLLVSSMEHLKSQCTTGLRLQPPCALRREPSESNSERRPGMSDRAYERVSRRRVERETERKQVQVESRGRRRPGAS